jgi:predicted ABC-type ATPase
MFRALKAEADAENWWHTLTREEQETYLNAHPHSKFQESASYLFHKYYDPTITAHHILANHPGTESKIARIKHVISKKAPTDIKYKDSEGRYTPEREALHKKIVSKIITPETVARAKPQHGEKPKVIFLGGRGGSGKSWLTSKDGPANPEKAIVINPDDIQDYLPGYKGWNAALYHEEASDIANVVEHIARKMGLNVILDSTMRTDKNLHRKIDAYEKHGYEPHGHYMYAPPHVAANRAMKRFKKSGRFVPVEYLLNSTSNEHSFDSAKPRFSKWSIWNNTEDSSPQLHARSK